MMQNSIKIFLTKLSALVFFFGLTAFAQNLTDKFNDAMDAHNKQLYSEANKSFDEILENYGTEDELYATVRFYSANSLLQMGKKEESTSGFEFIVNSIVWSKFREESLFKLGLIYYELNRFALSRKNHLMLVYQYPNSEYVGSSMYWIGESYSAEGRLDDAIEFLTQAIEDKSANRFRAQLPP